MKALWILLFCLVISVRAPKGPNELNVSKEPPNPLLFWSMAQSMHDTSYIQNHRYAFLERTGPPNASLISGTTMDVANFNTVGSKYILLNSFTDMGYPGYIDAISLSFNTYFTDTAQSTVLAQFIDAAGIVTVEVRLEATEVTAWWLDSNRVPYVGQKALAVPANKWLLIGFQFNMLWDKNVQVELYTVDIKGSTKFVEIGLGKITLPLMDKIVIGGDYFGGTTFKGEIGCIQIYDTSIIGGTRDDSFGLCDPKTMDPTNGAFTIESVFMPTTEDVTTEQTTEGVTTGQTTVDITTEQTTVGVTTGQTPSGVLTTGYEPVIENCNNLKIVQTDQVLASPIMFMEVTNLERCVTLCIENPQCLVFSMPTTGNGECRLGDTTVTTPMAGHTVYSV